MDTKWTRDGHSPDTTLIMGIHSTFSAATAAAAAKFISKWTENGHSEQILNPLLNPCLLAPTIPFFISIITLSFLGFNSLIWNIRNRLV